jgi:uncharacterized protein YidB (DUF937 family)
MSLLGNLVGQALGGLGGGHQQNLMQSAAGLLQGGGLEGLQQKFASAGLSHLLSSWIGTGQNQAISPAQLTQVLGHGTVQQLAQQAGVGHEDAASGLAQILPSLIDKLTPGGQAPSGNALQGGLASLLQGGVAGLFK